MPYFLLSDNWGGGGGRGEGDLNNVFVHNLKSKLFNSFKIYFIKIDY